VRGYYTIETDFDRFRADPRFNVLMKDAAG
jgi:hypothetical protein